MAACDVLKQLRFFKNKAIPDKHMMEKTTSENDPQTNAIIAGDLGSEKGETTESLDPHTNANKEDDEQQNQQSSQENFKCNLCNKSFTSLKYLSNHTAGRCLHSSASTMVWSLVRIQTFLSKVVRKWSGFSLFKYIQFEQQKAVLIRSNSDYLP